MKASTRQLGTLLLSIAVVHCGASEDGPGGGTGTGVGTGTGTGTGSGTSTGTGTGTSSDDLCLASLVAEPCPCEDAGGGGDHNCRLWAIISNATPAEVITEHLANLPDSLKNLADENQNGWGVGYYADDAQTPTVLRGEAAASADSSFDDAVSETGAATPRIAVSHVRNCTSGSWCDIPDPHPFVRELGGKTWLFGHNGALDVPMLVLLTDEAFLTEHPPEIGTDSSDWLDSELYFLLLLQTIEQHGWSVESAVASVAQQIHDASGPTDGLNFYLSDGESLWAYREGQSLSYVYDEAGTSCSAIASQPPTAAPGNWLPLSERNLVTLHQADAPDLSEIPY